METSRLSLFISYAHEDVAYLEEFQKHLKQLKREGIIEEWNDNAIMPGSNWNETIKSKIEESDIIVFLISSDFIASDYIHDVEIKNAIARHERDECILLPVIIRTCDFSSLPISRFQALPKGAKPVSTWEDKDAAWLDVVKQIRRLAEDLKKKGKNRNVISSTPTKTVLDQVETTKGIGSQNQEKTGNSIERNSYLFIIGIDKYQNSSFSDLGNAVFDSENVKKVLQEKYGFELIQPPIYNEDATRENIIEKMNSLCTAIGKEDNLIIYFAGHGEKHSITNKGFWVPHDANKSISDYVPNSSIKDYIEGIDAKHIFLISDSCFSGTFLTRTRSGNNERHYKKIDESKSRWVLSSGREEVVGDGMPGNGSPFANALVKILSENKNKFISTAEIINYVSRTTGSLVNQQPVGAHIENIGHEGGQMVLTLGDEFAKENIDLSPQTPNRSIENENKSVESIPSRRSEKKNQKSPNNQDYTNSNYTKSYKERVADGQIKQVITELMKKNLDTNQEVYNTLVLLLSRYNKNEGDSNKGIITDGAANMNRNKISHALIAVIDELEIK